MDTKRVSRIKAAELMSAVGAGFLGAGLALLWRDTLGAFAVPILIGGVVAHGLGMYLKHRWERTAAPLSGWINALYWLCWAILMSVVLYIAAS